VNIPWKVKRKYATTVVSKPIFSGVRNLCSAIKPTNRSGVESFF
jgi:hypothetical protein